MRRLFGCRGQGGEARKEKNLFVKRKKFDMYFTYDVKFMGFYLGRKKGMCLTSPRHQGQ